MTEMRWWGWGVDGHDPELTPKLAGLLRDELGITGAVVQTVPRAEDVALPASALPAAAARALGPGVATDHLTRLRRAAGRSYPDLVRLRAGRLETAPDAVVTPRDHADVQRILEVCAEHRIAVVPFGGGTSVVGGVEALRGGCAAVVALDLRRLDHVVADPLALTATFGAGVFGPAAEQQLQAQGLTLGHYPQSFEFSTVGGWVATRSAGQASTGVGRIDELVRSVRAATPAGELETLLVPATAAGPDLRQLLVGSEGVLGVITEATLRVRRRPERGRYEAWSVPDFATGARALRLLEQHEVAPDIARLSDAPETRLSLALAGDGAGPRALERYLGLRGHAGGCLIITGWEGGAEIGARRHAAAKVLREAGAISLAAPIGRAWRKGRFHGPYLRDVLMGRGVLVDTLETATEWGQVDTLHAAVAAALHEALGRAYVACHISHVYRDGCSLYFTYAAAQERGDELGQWRRAKAAASDAIAAHRATITHHHGVGCDHAPWMRAEVGDLGLEVLRAAKATLDPAGIMNPGKVLPD
jgi:alkyldihydroxyacetonephosphate synthase